MQARAPDATGLADLVRRKQASPRELLHDALRKCEALNPQLNAVLSLAVEHAEASIAQGLPAGPFTGVPFLLKDLGAPAAGIAMTMGSRALAGHVPSADSEYVRRCRHAGLVIMGTTLAPELGILPTTESAAYGATRNPWDLERSAGGSSGGAAAAVAAGIVPMAHGNDAGGSIRIPASCCGLFGMKPSRGRNPFVHGVGALGALLVNHVLTRSVRDSAAMLDATLGDTSGALFTLPPPAMPYAEQIRRPTERLKIAMTLTPMGGTPVDPECTSAALKTAQLLEQLGHTVVEDAPRGLDLEATKNAWVVYFCVNVATLVTNIQKSRNVGSEHFEPLAWTLAEIGRQVSALQLVDAWSQLQATIAKVAELSQRYEVWLTPTLSELPPPLGTFESKPDDPLAGVMRAERFMPWTLMSNLSGQPAMSVPLHWSASGLPVGTQLIGRHGDESTLFCLAAELEQAQPWCDRLPPTHAAGALSLG